MQQCTGTWGKSQPPHQWAAPPVPWHSRQDLPSPELLLFAFTTSGKCQESSPQPCWGSCGVRNVPCRPPGICLCLHKAMTWGLWLLPWGSGEKPPKRLPTSLGLTALHVQLPQSLALLWALSPMALPIPFHPFLLTNISSMFLSYKA